MKKVLFATVLSLGLLIGCAKAPSSNPGVFMGSYVGANGSTLNNDASTMKLTENGTTRTFMYTTDGTSYAQVTAEILPGGALGYSNLPSRMYKGETSLLQLISGSTASDFMFVGSN